MKVLVTGAKGFIGHNLISALRHINLDVYGTERVKSDEINFFSVDLKSADWDKAVSDKDVVIHCAGISSEDGSVSDDFELINVEATKKLAESCRKHNVKKLIFLSSAKVMGESTEPGLPFYSYSALKPIGLYAESKASAELKLKEELSGSDVDLIVIRPPLVYGRGVKGNFRTLSSVANLNFPLPIKSVRNSRSLLALDNLIDFIVTCIMHPTPLNGVFLVSDDCDVSTKELLEALTLAYGKSPRLLPFPVSLMRAAAGLFSKHAISDRLLGNLQLDISHTKQTLNWQPKVSFEQAIQDYVRDELNSSDYTKGSKP
ncbi:NAD-dependent epimerase/dehydratase family protein [Aliidiomarina maris]|uniref:UDP-glucose 4-epimerase n=1 Tax=Aliidiomarina maris TaxID=531312 RepID=A0A327WPG2_9GAMM|nr:NAD-dependent epimerase/dehydratase family protein [Aliidiomarina maris]RAJ93624.1 UDP-glucose 4-epimerase [Aliidiomarina maris]RUO19075.1 hypothetical protein CWE07_13275 [Aliidiomarina maris]